MSAESWAQEIFNAALNRSVFSGDGLNGQLRSAGVRAGEVAVCPDAMPIGELLARLRAKVKVVAVVYHETEIDLYQIKRLS